MELGDRVIYEAKKSEGTVIAWSNRGNECEWLVQFDDVTDCHDGTNFLGTEIRGELPPKGSKNCLFVSERLCKIIGKEQTYNIWN